MNRLLTNTINYIKQKLLLQYVIALVLITSIYVIIKIFINFNSKNELAYKNNNDFVIGINIPKNLNFCGEAIPANNLEIKKNIEEEFLSTANWKNNAALIFTKAERWFPYIEPILKEENVPTDFKYVAVIESHLSNVVSPAGAVGFWQLVKSSAQNYDLEINEFVDERYDVEKSTRAACKLFKEAHKEFNNYTLAAAAYNLGIGGISRALKNQNKNNYYDLKLNAETKAFVYRILAYKTLLEHPENFGIKRKKFKPKSKLAYTKIEVDSSITNLKFLATKLKCPVLTLKIFNPWFVGEKLPNPTNKKYIFSLPKNFNDAYSEYMRDLIGEDGAALNTLDLGMAESTNVPDSVKILTHTVTINETIKELADFYEVNPLILKKWNNYSDTCNYLKPGTVLKLFFPVKKN